jgi:putative MATE family efflux protein
MSFQYAINQLVMIIDNLMVGSLGEASISAISICGTYFWLNITFTTALSSGATVIISKLWGANEKHNIKKIMSFVFVVNLVISLLFFGLTTFFPSQIIRIYSDVESVVAPGVAYLNIIRFASLLNGITMLIVGLLQSVHSVNIGMYGSMISCVFNVFFNYVLIFGKFGFPAMGVEGAAIATLITRVIEFIVCTVYVFRFEKNICFRLSDFDPKIEISEIKELVDITMPIMLIEVLSNFASSMQTIITGHISEYYISANSIVHLSWMLTTFFTYGLRNAASILIGNAIGAKDLDRARRLCRGFLMTSIAVGACAAVVVQFVVPVISSFYNVSIETLDLAKLMSYAASANVLFLVPAHMALDGIYKVVENSRTVLILNCIGNWLLALPLGYLCAFVLHTNAAVIYFVLRSGNLFNAVSGTILLKKKGWI